MDIEVVTLDGTQSILAVDPGENLKDALQRGGIDDILAICGGSCSCATCHVFITGPNYEVPSIDEAEDELLDTSRHRKPTSRLACQVVADAHLVGATVTVAPQD